VLVTVNRPALGLFNGDVGICLERPAGSASTGATAGDLVVVFGDANGVRSVPVFAMPACEDAWAMTIHKSQGSEFEAVSLVLGPAGHRLHTRELVYTGITRARSRLSVWAPAQALERAARVGVARHGRLQQRLSHGAAGSEGAP
jgi:exodeoxyribonuclease V alpha subunit